MDADGRNQQTIVDFRKTDFFANEHFNVKSLCKLNWSPQGDFIAFENRCISNGAADPHDVFITAVDGSRVEPVTQFPESPDSSIIDYGYSSTWSQSGDKLFIGYSKTDVLNTSWWAAGGFLIVDVNTFTSVNSPEIYGLRTGRSWSPNQDFFVAHTLFLHNGRFLPGPTRLSKLDNEGNLTLLAIPGGLPSGSYHEPAVYWSPDGLFMAYATEGRDQDNDDNVDYFTREISIVSTQDWQIKDVPLTGNIRPLGWFVKDNR